MHFEQLVAHPQPRETMLPTAPASDEISPPVDVLHVNDVASIATNDAHRYGCYQARSPRAAAPRGFAYRFDDATSLLASANVAADVVDGCGPPLSATPTHRPVCDRLAARESPCPRGCASAAPRRCHATACLTARRECGERRHVASEEEASRAGEAAVIGDKENGAEASTSRAFGEDAQLNVDQTDDGKGRYRYGAGWARGRAGNQIRDAACFAKPGSRSVGDPTGPRKFMTALSNHTQPSAVESSPGRCSSPARPSAARPRTSSLSLELSQHRRGRSQDSASSSASLVSRRHRRSQSRVKMATSAPPLSDSTA